VLKTLLDRKGVLSRQIGEAKRAGEAIDVLLAEMKELSAQIKALQASAKEQAKLTEQTTEEKTVEAPKLFSGISYTGFTDSIDSVEVKSLDDSQCDAWDAYVQTKDNSAVYHLSAFRDIISQSFGHKALYLAAYKASGEICGVLPAVEMKSGLFGHFIVSLPFFTYGSVLADNAEVEKKLCASLFAYAEKEGIEHVELRAMFARDQEAGAAPSKDHKVSMVRVLPETSEQLWSDIGTKVRAQIKKAQRFPLELKFGGRELLDDYYAVFAENMRDLGTPVYSKGFFSILMESALSEQFTIGVVYHQNKPVSCCFLMKHKDMMEIPWASTLHSVNHMNVNMFMYWGILEKAIKEECQFFDFGRSSKDANTYRFKKQWGAKPQQLYWYYWLPEGKELPELNPDNPKYKLLIAVWQRLPVWLTKLIGPPVIKYIP
jgi:FemAB-related protein (PEP-CTERM system-associated)